MTDNRYEGDHSNPIYAAGFKEGREFEAERLKKVKRKPQGIPVNVKITEMPLFTELLGLTVEMANVVADHNDPRGKVALQRLEEIVNREPTPVEGPYTVTHD